MRNEQVEKVVEFLRENVQCYPQVSDDEPGGYYSETDKMMDEAADLLERLQSRIEALEKDAVRLDYVVDSIGKHGPDAVVGYLIDEDGFVLTGYKARKSIDTAMQSEKGG